MKTLVVPYKLGHLLLEGAIMAVCTELVFRCIFAPNKQKSWKIRALRIIMALGMAIKSSLIASYSGGTLGDNCSLAVRLSDLFFHISCLAGFSLLLLRVQILAPAKYKGMFTIFHIGLLLLRTALGISDLVLVKTWTEPDTLVCSYKDMSIISIAYSAVDLFIDIYVSVLVSIILSMHIRSLKEMAMRSKLNLYASIVIANVFRSVTLSILNLLTIVYFVAATDSPGVVLIAWPVNDLLFVVLIGYDTNIARTLSKLQSYVTRDRQQYLHQRMYCDNHSSSVLGSSQQINMTVQNAKRHFQTGRASSVASEIDESSIVKKQSDFSFKRESSSSTSTILDMTMSTTTPVNKPQSNDDR